MSLVTMKELLKRASDKNIAVGAFNVANMEMLIGAITAAEKLDTPIIIQVAESRLAFSPLYLIAPMMVEAARKASVPVAVNFDHGKTLENIGEALKYGFTSVMFDGSSFSMEENVRKTNECADLASKYGATVEGELGVLAGNEGDGDVAKSLYTKPDDAVSFAKEAHIDALAVAIGNAHGKYVKTPNLQFDILKEIHERVDLPLVLHGGTGISPEDFQKCIRLGVRKVNIATANFEACLEGAMNLAGTEGPKNYFTMNEAMVECVRENVEKHINIFNMR
ncbi:MAG: ketose-bisphosphate aldolase [Lachnospiraceae bacterium]|nr:ketose-bisphosphate aldolase [Lachnospiraceae bacterium]